VVGSTIEGSTKREAARRSGAARNRSGSVFFDSHFITAAGGIGLTSV
jgi:hypothetical protein